MILLDVVEQITLEIPHLVDWHIVEFEEVDIDIYEAMRRSYDYLVGGGMSAGRTHT